MAVVEKHRANARNAAARIASTPTSPSVRAAPTWVGRLTESPTLLIGAGLLAIYVTLALIGPLLAPYSATEFHLADKLQGPSATYLFGTDQYGRDIFSRILIGTRGILILATTASGLGLLLGVAVGTVAAYSGGRADEALMRLMDALMSFPSLLMAMLILAMAEPSLRNIIVGIAVVFTPRVARVVRSVALGLKSQEYVEAARLRGESAWYIMVAEILPNALGPIIVEGSIRVSYAVLLGASLGFLGLGVQPPAPDWGLMVSEARNFILIAPWMVLFPSLAVAGLVVGANLFSDGLSRSTRTGR